MYSVCVPMLFQYVPICVWVHVFLHEAFQSESETLVTCRGQVVSVEDRVHRSNSVWHPRSQCLQCVICQINPLRPCKRHQMASKYPVLQRVGTSYVPCARRGCRPWLSLSVKPCCQNCQSLAPGRRSQTGARRDMSDM